MGSASSLRRSEATHDIYRVVLQKETISSQFPKKNSSFDMLPNCPLILIGNCNTRTDEAIYFEPPTKIRQVSCGGETLCVLTEQGEIFAYGNSNYKQFLLATKFTTFTKVELPKPCIFTCGGHLFHVHMYEDGIIQGFGYNDCGQISGGRISAGTVGPLLTKKDFHGQQVTGFSSAYAHTLFLTENQEVYGVGYNGQDYALAISSGSYSVELQKLDVNVKNIRRVAAGGYFSYLLSGQKDVWVSSSQGFVQTNAMQVIPENEAIVDVVVNSSQCFLLTSGGSVFYGKGNDFKRIKFDRPIKLIAARGRLFVFATEFQVFNEDCQPIIPPLENGLVICQLDITETEWIAYCDNPITNKFKKRLWAECVKGELTDVCLTFASNYDC